MISVLAQERKEEIHTRNFKNETYLRFACTRAPRHCCCAGADRVDHRNHHDNAHRHSGIRNSEPLSKHYSGSFHCKLTGLLAQFTSMCSVKERKTDPGSRAACVSTKATPNVVCRPILRRLLNDGSGLCPFSTDLPDNFVADQIFNFFIRHHFWMSFLVIHFSSLMPLSFGLG